MLLIVTQYRRRNQLSSTASTSHSPHLTVTNTRRTDGSVSALTSVYSSARADKTTGAHKRTGAAAKEKPAAESGTTSGCGQKQHPKDATSLCIALAICAITIRHMRHMREARKEVYQHYNSTPTTRCATHRQRDTCHTNRRCSQPRAARPGAHRH